MLDIRIFKTGFWSFATIFDFDGEQNIKLSFFFVVWHHFVTFSIDEFCGHLCMPYMFVGVCDFSHFLFIYVYYTELEIKPN